VHWQRVRDDESAIGSRHGRATLLSFREKAEVEVVLESVLGAIAEAPQRRSAKAVIRGLATPSRSSPNAMRVSRPPPKTGEEPERAGTISKAKRRHPRGRRMLCGWRHCTGPPRARRARTSQDARRCRQAPTTGIAEGGA
jgi:hypothetical protein